MGKTGTVEKERKNQLTEMKLRVKRYSLRNEERELDIERRVGFVEPEVGRKIFTPRNHRCVGLKDVSEARRLDSKAEIWVEGRREEVRSSVERRSASRLLFSRVSSALDSSSTHFAYFR